MLFGDEFFEFVVGGIYFGDFVFGCKIGKNSIYFTRNRIRISGY